MTIEEKFSRLGVDNAPGQESLQADLPLELLGDPLPGAPVDFSHGDVDAFRPAPGSLECFLAGVEEGARQAYTPYRGRRAVLEDLAAKLAAFTGCPIDPARNIILAPGTQGALFLAMGACVQRGDPVAFLEPDYFANRKMIEFLDGRLLPVPLDYTRDRSRAGVDLAALEQAFQAGAKVFLFSNPNNPTGVVFTEQEQRAVAKLARAYGVTLLVDSLYARQIFDGRPYCHMCSLPEAPEEMLTIIGPSKTESLSGYRLGVAFGSAAIVQRMEKLLAIMALRCPGYNQGVFFSWFNEPAGWMAERVRAHQAIRDDILALLAPVAGVEARPTEGGSYLFIRLPELTVSLHTFVRIARQQAGVTVTPGTEFGPQFTAHIRINFSQDHKKAVAAMERLLTLVEAYRA